MKEGDLVLFSGTSFVDRVVQVGTLSLYSHVAIYSRYGLLFESTSAKLPPCVIQHRHVKGAQAHYFDTRLAAYKGRAWRLPLAHPVDEELLYFFLRSQLGRPYDFLGAFRSGGIFWNRIMRAIHPESLSALFCSEFCAAALDRVRYFNTGNASAWSPAKLARALGRRGLVLRPERLK